MPTKKQLESEFAKKLKEKLNDRFPGCFIYKMDPVQRQGIPDLLVLHEDNWALLETKRAFGSKKQPNQDIHVEAFNEQSFSAFVSPENCEEVLDALQTTWGARG